MALSFLLFGLLWNLLSAKAPHYCCNADIRKYGRTTSASGTTTVATPAPHSAATALAGAAATKGPAPMARVQTSALSASLADTTQPPSSPEDPSETAGQHPQPQLHRVSNIPIVVLCFQVLCNLFVLHRTAQWYLAMLILCDSPCVSLHIFCLSTWPSRMA